MKKKIMHIVQSPGGVERYILMLLKNMDLTKYDNILVCSLDYKEENYKGLVIAFEHVDMVRSISIKSDLKAVLKVRKLIKRYEPDIVYMHSSKGGAIGRVANFGLKNNCIYNPHGWAFNMDCGAKKKTMYHWVEKLLAPACDVIIAISDYEKKSAIQCKICKPDKIKVIFNGIDIAEYEKKKETFTLTRGQLGIPEGAYVIGTVGRLTKQKAPDIFIKAATRIKNEIPEAYFVMVGDGELQPQIEELIKKLGLEDSVLITGWVKEPMEYIQLFNQSMLLSRWEGFGLVLAEYMLAGKPILATKVDAIPELITNGENGLLVEMDGVDEVVTASIKLARDMEMSSAFVKNGHTVVRNKFDIKRVVSEFNGLIS